MARPRIIENSQVFDRLAKKYFDSCQKEKRRPTLTGLVLALGLSSRQSLDDYQGREEFLDSVKRAKLRIEEAYEDRLDGNSPAGAIFALKNFGWSDRSQLDHSSSDGSMSPAGLSDEVRAFVEALASGHHTKEPKDGGYGPD